MSVTSYKLSQLLLITQPAEHRDFAASLGLSFRLSASQASKKAMSLLIFDPAAAAIPLIRFCCSFFATESVLDGFAFSNKAAPPKQLLLSASATLSSPMPMPNRSLCRLRPTLVPFHSSSPF